MLGTLIALVVIRPSALETRFVAEFRLLNQLSSRPTLADLKRSLPRGTTLHEAGYRLDSIDASLYRVIEIRGTVRGEARAFSRANLAQFESWRRNRRQIELPAFRRSNQDRLMRVSIDAAGGRLPSVRSEAQFRRRLSLLRRVQSGPPNDIGYMEGWSAEWQSRKLYVSEEEMGRWFGPRDNLASIYNPVDANEEDFVALKNAVAGRRQTRLTISSADLRTLRRQQIRRFTPGGLLSSRGNLIAYFVPPAPFDGAMVHSVAGRRVVLLTILAG